MNISYGKYDAICFHILISKTKISQGFCPANFIELSVVPVIHHAHLVSQCIVNPDLRFVRVQYLDFYFLQKNYFFMAPSILILPGPQKRIVIPQMRNMNAFSPSENMWKLCATVTATSIPIIIGITASLVNNPRITKMEQKNFSKHHQCKRNS